MSSFLTRAATPSMYCEVGDISTSFKGVISINEDILKQQAAGAEMRFSLLHVMSPKALVKFWTFVGEAVLLVKILKS